MKTTQTNQLRPLSPFGGRGACIFRYEPEHEDAFHKKDFSSNNRHFITFPREQIGKQLHVFARYSNAHGKEGPEGPTEVAVIN